VSETTETGPAAHVRPAREPKDKSYSAPVRAALGQLGLRAAARMPLSALHAIGGVIGRALALLPTRERLATRVNLELCFPEMSRGQRAQLARASSIETGRTMAELAALWCWAPERVLALVREVRGFELVEAARARGPVLCLTPHLGAWELAGLYLASRVSLTSLYKPPRIREMEAFYTQARERTGATLVRADVGGVRALHRALRSGGVIGVLPDQDPGRGSGVFLPWFGVPANTTTLVAKLLHKSEASLIIVWCERLGPGAGFRMNFSAPDATGMRAADVEVSVRAMIRELERLIRTAPAQYLWSYKRFRNRPPGEADLYRRAPRAPGVPRA
jgi:KDO2-lipid IV(A) lauroyltransferase